MRTATGKLIPLAFAAAALTLLLACALGGLAVRRGSVSPPEVDINLGAARLIGRVSIIPYCSQLIAPDCLSPNPVLSQRIYTLWLFIRTERASWDSPRIHRLFAVPVGAAGAGP